MPSSNQGHKQMLLILEADEQQSHSLSLLLGTYGYQTTRLKDVKALKKYRFVEKVAYCLLVDVGTKLKTHQVLHDYICDTPQLPVIAMSVASNVNLAVAYTRMGTVSFLPKPLQIENLLKAVNEGLKLSEEILAYRQQREAFELRASKLSPRENQVLQMVVDGMSSSQIARELELSVKTVSLHRTNLMSKLEADGVVHLVRMTTHGPLPKPALFWQHRD